MNTSPVITTAPSQVGTAVSYSGLIAKFDAMLGRSVEAIAAVLLVSEIILLFSGVVARYVLVRPLLWSDELAVILFLWIGMLGAVIAARDGQHMRFTLLVNSVGLRARSRLNAFSELLSIGLLVGLFLPSIAHVREHWDILTPTLRISEGVRLTALPVGLALIAITLTMRFVKNVRPPDFLFAVVTVAAIAALIWLTGPAMAQIGNWDLAVFFGVGVAALIVIGAPIAFAFGAATFAYLAATGVVPLSIEVARIDGGISDLLLLAIPLFIVLGLLIELTGMARALVELLASLFGHLRGGMSFSLFGAMFLVSGISGSKAADIAAIAPVMVPEMQKRGYKSGELVALLSSSAAASETIPPSLVLIALGSVAGISIAKLFAAGLVPAVIAGVFLVLLAYLRARRGDTQLPPRVSWRSMRKAFVKALPALVLPFMIRATVVGGVATATEVATLGIAYAIVAGLIFYRDAEWRRIFRLLVRSASLSGSILLILGMATAMAWALTQSGFSQDLIDAVSAIPGGKVGFILVTILIFLILGSVMEGMPALVLLAPLMIPAAQTMGIDEIHYSMVIILSMGVGLFAPPFGVGYYMTCAISGLSVDDGISAIWPYLAALLVAIVVVGLLPGLPM
ncbi:tripartite ATP-independent transporter DctM subunit [Rhodopseudomonas rhenobacensis]|uniref:Tripartite ATP-independent transporter DctM subunit n=1 Tax=Rhodopseudomonas rhenobacensis TaxID=87461 RepID=A0A7W7Z4W2_9BRAD|nr:TRAP transporter large permease subunit [Rhodopseudomonas rhenobacensis]MBB5048068.1 tripartite ATP-independent transporter DctM subunit [Rhodopseudomonas rhenobacensis]